MVVLQTEGLCKVYRQGETRVEALRDAALTVEAGEFAAIVGTSGSGKSTLLHLCAGLLRPSGGRVLLEGKDLTAVDERTLARIRRQRIGVVFQRFDLLPGLTARENIVLPALLDRRKPDAAWFDALVGMLEIADRLEHLPGELSGGQMQRVAIARALINRPAILIADEPTGNLDRATADEIMALFAQLHGAKHTMILVTHDETVAAHADTVWRMEDGMLSRLGTMSA